MVVGLWLSLIYTIPPFHRNPWNNTGLTMVCLNECTFRKASPLNLVC